jgi:hypothetical protein
MQYSKQQLMQLQTDAEINAIAAAAADATSQRQSS